MNDSDDYIRGVNAGRVESRLDDHSRRLDGINGSVAATGEQLLQLTKQISMLADAVSTMSLSVRESEDARKKYVPLLDGMTQRRITWLRGWHIAGLVFLVVLPQIVTIVFHV